MSTKIRHKRGDTFRLRCTYQDGTPPVAVSLIGAGMTPRSQIRQHGVLIQSLTITLANQTLSPGQFDISALPSETAVWPVGELEYDIRYASASGEVRSTDTAIVVCEQGPTV